MKQHETSRWKPGCVLVQVCAPELRTSKDFCLYKVCGVSSGTSASASQGEAVPGAGSAQASQHQEKRAHNMLCPMVSKPMSFMALSHCQNIQRRRVCNSPSPGAGLGPAQGKRSLFGLPAYMRHDPHFATCPTPVAKQITDTRHSWGFAVPPRHSLGAFVTRHSISY